MVPVNSEGMVASAAGVRYWGGGSCAPEGSPVCAGPVYKLAPCTTSAKVSLFKSEATGMGMLGEFDGVGEAVVEGEKVPPPPPTGPADAVPAKSAGEGVAMELGEPGRGVALEVWVLAPHTPPP